MRRGVIFNVIAMLSVFVIVKCFIQTRPNIDDVPISLTSKRNPTTPSGSVQSYKGNDIMLGVVLTHNAGHTEFTASTIRKFHNIEEEHIYIFTRQGHGYSKRSLNNWYGDNVTIYNQASFKKILQTFIHSNYKTLFLVDSNIVFLPGWSDLLTRCMIKGNTSFLSLYHSAQMHNFTTDCQRYVGELCEGILPSKLGVAISRELASKIIPIVDLFGLYDWNGILMRENTTALYPRKSLVMHIDHANRDENFCGETDVPYEFQLCDLPAWVRGGIEFYFDRCTNPNELYSPNFSNDMADLDRRMWTKPVISYSLYGKKTRYTDGAIANAKRIFSVYPGWKIWMYIDDSVPDKLTRQLCSKNVRLINFSGADIKNQMSWRFLVSAAPVKMFAVRDVDYRIIIRDKEAVDDWIKSKRKFHVMRDHMNHARFSISGGMWGGVGESIPNIKQLILQYNGNNNYLMDMNFLDKVIWPIVKQSVWVHDSYSLHKFGEDHQFPTNRRNDEFVGSIDFT